MIDLNIVAYSLRRCLPWLVFWVAWACRWYVVDERGAPTGVPLEPLLFGLFGTVLLPPGEGRLMGLLPVRKRVQANTMFFLSVLLIPAMITLALSVLTVSGLAPFRLSRLPQTFVLPMLGGGTMFFGAILLRRFGDASGAGVGYGCGWLPIVFFTMSHRRETSSVSLYYPVIAAAMTLAGFLLRARLLGVPRTRNVHQSAWRDLLASVKRTTFGVVLFGAVVSWALAVVSAPVLIRLQGLGKACPDLYAVECGYAIILGALSIILARQWVSSLRLVRTLPLTATRVSWLCVRGTLIVLLVGSLPMTALGFYMGHGSLQDVVLRYLIIASASVWISILDLLICIHTRNTEEDPSMLLPAAAQVGLLLLYVCVRAITGSILREPITLADPRFTGLIGINATIAAGAFASLRLAIIQNSTLYRVKSRQ